MKKLALLLILAAAANTSNAQTYKVVTIVESIIPAGTGRSRIIETTSTADLQGATTERTDGKKSDQDEVKREDLKVNEFKETKLLNFFSGVGINFQNIASNDAMIGEKINSLVAEGWSLDFVVSGVESDGGNEDNQGIYITRLIFKKQ